MRRLLGLVLAVTAGAAHAQATCDDQRGADKYGQLRRLSLDLLGRVPTAAEYDALDAVGLVDGGLPASVTQRFFDGDDFRRTMRRVHEELFWPNISNLTLSSNPTYLAATNVDTGDLDTTADGGTLVFLRSNITTTYRGDFFRLNESDAGMECGDFEQTQFDPAYPNQFRPLPSAVRTYTDPADAGGRVHRQEGWRWVQPYWAPAGTMVRACAYDAQETVSYTVGTTTVTCTGSTQNLACGCGPNLRLCQGTAADWRTPLADSFREQVNRAVDHVTVDGGAYTDLLLSTRADVNGTISHFRRYQAQSYTLSRIFTRNDPSETLSTVPAHQRDTWVTVDRGGLHAGVLTMPAFLLRFQTNRARANRLYQAFECETFEPPATLENVGDTTYGAQACVDDTTDLTRKCTCRKCHQQPEPRAAGWGTFSEAGLSSLNATEYPRIDRNCLDAGTPATRRAECNRFYVTDPTEPNAGALLSFQYAVNSTAAAEATHKAMYDAFQAGPRRKAQELVTTKVFARCTTRRFFTYLMKREPRLVGTTSEAAVINQLADRFIASGYQLPTLLNDLVSRPEYRSVR